MTLLNKVDSLGRICSRILLVVFALSTSVVGQLSQTHAQATLTVETDATNYKAGDTIRVSGRVADVNAGQAVIIQVIDEEGNRDLLVEADMGSDGSYEYSFETRGTLDTDGTYLIMASHGNDSVTSTFYFDAEEPEAEWRTVQVAFEDQERPIEYKITGRENRLDGISADPEAISLLVSLYAPFNGSLSLRFDEEVFDAEEFVIFISDNRLTAESSEDRALNELFIGFSAGTDEIEIIGDRIVPELSTSTAIVALAAVSTTALLFRLGILRDLFAHALD